MDAVGAPFDEAAARAYLSQARQLRADDQRMQLAITTNGAAPLGEILLFRTGTVGEAELAYAIGAAHRRQGLASRAVRLMISYAYDVLALIRLLLRIAEDNLASAVVASGCGFQLTDAAPVTRQTAQDPLLTWQHTLCPTPRDAGRVAIRHVEHREEGVFNPERKIAVGADEGTALRKTLFARDHHRL